MALGTLWHNIPSALVLQSFFGNAVQPSDSKSLQTAEQDSNF